MARPEPTAKRGCAGGQAVAGDGVDRLSALPDGLLHAVLSFLPAPQVVRTCVLSRRWRRLWRSAPRVNVDELNLGITVPCSRGDLEARWGRFEDFADNLLLFHDSTSSLGEFRYSSHLYNPRQVDRWVRRGIEYCPAVLEIQTYSFSDHRRFKLPPVAASSLHRLKTLRLSNVNLGCNFTDLLCSGCPFLEDLEFCCCDFYGNCSQGITIASPTLNKLVMNCCKDNTSHPLVITAPSLVYLRLHFGCYKNGISLHKMDSLVTASIYTDENQTFTEKNQRELLGSLFNLTGLELLGFETEVMMLSDKPDKCPIFCNMRTLYLYGCFLDEYDLNEKLEALECFLHNAPFLEKLTLERCMFVSFSDSEWEIERKNITLQHQDKKTFQCPKLKLVEVMYEYDHDHQLIELLWNLGKSLPNANIKLTKVK
ncbi:hypothetical protein ACP70R_048213 [Stipagrostis hirtigluma subsp. patula]